MNTINIDLDELKKFGLFPHEFMLLSIINEGFNPDSYIWPDGVIQNMTENIWITKDGEGQYLLRGKAKVFFETKESIINFDEFWDAFPAATPSGRVLRSESKIWGGRPTKDYVTCKRKYLSKVKDINAHNKILTIIKARVNSRDYDYINGMEVYINKEAWQQDSKYLTTKAKTGNINEMV